MATQLPLLFRSLKKHRAVVALLLIQVTITCALVTNILFLLSDRLVLLRSPTGLNESGLAVVESEFVGTAPAQLSAKIDADLRTLQGIPGVSQVAVSDALPLSENNWTVGVTNAPLDLNNPSGIIEAEPSLYGGSPKQLSAMGAKLIHGAGFSSDAFVQMGSADDFSGLYKVGQTVITQAMADHLFPGENAVGRAIYVDGTHALQVVGIVEHLARPVLKQVDDNDMSILLPLIPDGSRVIYLLKTDKNSLPRILEAASAALQRNDVNRIMKRVESYEDLKDNYFRRDSMMAVLLSSSGLALLIVTGLGISGLAGFWVRQRHRNVGIRRALGATSGSIIRYFLVENFLISIVGVVLGSLGALLVNQGLMSLYEVPRIHLGFVFAGAVVVCMLGQLSVWVPAHSAAVMHPVDALRGRRA